MIIFSKKISIEFFKDKITLWKLTRKGFYKFVQYIDEADIDVKKLRKKYKGYEVKDKTGHIETQIL